MHIALLGDSTIDNAAYTGREPDVATHLRNVVGSAAKVSLLAVDGSRAEDMAAQFRRVTKDVTHVIVSVGGNDALESVDLLDKPVRSSAEVLRSLGERAATFERSYRHVVAALLALGRDATVCTIYNGNLPPDQALLARVALTVFNDALLRVAFEHGLRVIDLRAICASPADYANPIEPSGSGGLKIAQAIARAVALLPPPPVVASVLS